MHSALTMNRPQLCFEITKLVLFEWLQTNPLLPYVFYFTTGTFSSQQ